MNASYDVVVLGAGPGGYVAAIRASQLGLRTAIVERRFWGGVCLNIGCVPSKALLRNADLVRLLRHDAAAFGIHVSDPGAVTFDYAEAVRRSRRVAAGRARGVQYLMRKNRIDAFEGHGTFLDPWTLAVRDAEGGRQVVTFGSAIIATGASPRSLPGLPDDPRVVTYEAQILSEELPRRMLVVGGGAIGVESATLMEAYGTEVTIVEAADRLVPSEDEEISLFLRKQLERRGVRVETGAQLASVTAGPESITAVLGRDREEGAPLHVDRVLLAIGFRANTGGLGLVEAGVRVDGRGAIDVDERGRTSAPHIFAIGDVTARMMLAHAAEAMGLIAAEAIAGQESAPLDLGNVPRVTFSHPQIASVGATEAEARARHGEVAVGRFPFQANGKAQGLGDHTGFVKLIGDPVTGRLLGAHAIGAEVSELLPELTLARAAELTVADVARNVHAHPTLGEAIKDAAHVALGHAINL